MLSKSNWQQTPVWRREDLHGLVSWKHLINGYTLSNNEEKVDQEMQFSSNKFQMELTGLLKTNENISLKFSFYRKLEPILYMAISYKVCWRKPRWKHLGYNSMKLFHWGFIEDETLDMWLLDYTTWLKDRV